MGLLTKFSVNAYRAQLHILVAKGLGVSPNNLPEILKMSLDQNAVEDFHAGVRVEDSARWTVEGWLKGEREED